MEAPRGMGFREGCAPPHWGWGLGNFLELLLLIGFIISIKLVLYQNGEFSCILGSNYRLAACFTQIGNTCGIEIYWRSFRHFGAIITPSRKMGAKMTQIRQKLFLKKTCAKIVLFLYIFRIYSLKIFENSGLGEGSANSTYAGMCINWVTHANKSFLVILVK